MYDILQSLRHNGLFSTVILSNQLVHIMIDIIKIQNNELGVFDLVSTQDKWLNHSC